jgi:hypothetical protein
MQAVSASFPEWDFRPRNVRTRAVSEWRVIRTELPRRGLPARVAQIRALYEWRVIHSKQAAESDNLGVIVRPPPAYYRAFTEGSRSQRRGAHKVEVMMPDLFRPRRHKELKQPDDYKPHCKERGQEGHLYSVLPTYGRDRAHVSPRRYPQRGGDPGYAWITVDNAAAAVARNFGKGRSSA